MLKENLQHLIAYLNEDKKVYSNVVLIGSVIGVLEFFSVSALMPTVTLFLNGNTDNIPNIIKPLVDVLGSTNIILLFILLITAQTYINILNEQYFVTQIARWRTKLSIEYINNILNSKFENYTQLNPGEIEVMITRNIGFAMKIRHRTAIFLSDNVLAIFYVGIALYISAYTILLFFLLGLIYLSINKVTIHLRIKYSQIAKDKYITAAKHISEYFGDIRTLKSYKNEHLLSKVATELHDASIAQKHTDKMNVLIKHIFQPIMIILIFLTIYISKLFLEFDNATILVMLYIFYRAAPKMIEAAKGYGEILGDSPSDVVPDIKKWAKYGNTMNLTLKVPQDMNIKFRIKELLIKNHLLIKNLNINIQDKEIVSFIGKSGSGKSTILDSICGFLELQSTSLYIDNIPHCEIDYQNFLLEKVALVRQEAKIISGTIAENIAYLSDEIDKTKVIELINLLGLNHFLKDRNGVDTVMEVRGEGISAGQKQRIILARALYKNPKLLILDEPTSNLDKKTEQDIIEVLKSLRNKMTILIASHSNDVVDISDKVFHIENQEIKRVK